MKFSSALFGMVSLAAVISARATPDAGIHANIAETEEHACGHIYTGNNLAGPQTGLAADRPHDLDGRLGRSAEVTGECRCNFTMQDGRELSIGAFRGNFDGLVKGYTCKQTRHVDSISLANRHTVAPSGLYCGVGSSGKDEQGTHTILIGKEGFFLVPFRLSSAFVVGYCQCYFYE
ncbi:hypothetical protein N0V90_008581 [Kalmusia sp. IMI 367209]|nr:hypothetical protein N0V90_008581 [Kalmusia sp. IMI 367209]